MKKAKNMKKFNKPLAKVLKKVKSLTTRAAGMAAKTTKKPETKAPLKAKAAASKPAKAAPKAKLKAAPAPKATPAAKAVAGKKGTAPATAKAAVKPEAAKKGAKAQVVAAVLSKAKAAGAPAPVAAKGAAGKKGKAAKATIHLAEGERLCRENACENIATTKGYCRLDYIKNWKKIKRKEMILKEGKLNQYIEELVGKYPDKYIDVIRQDLSSEVNFNKVIHDLELDESIDDLEYDGDSIDALIGGIRKEDGGFDDSEF